MAREMPARAMRLGPSPRAVRHPPRCALDVYTRHGLWWLPRGNDMRQIVPGHSVCSLQGRAAEQRPRCLSHASHRWTTSIHGAFFGTGCPCVLLSTIPIAIIRDGPSFCVQLHPRLILGCKGPDGHPYHGNPTCCDLLIDIKRPRVNYIYYCPW